MTLSLRARLTLWYTLVLLAVLLAGGAAVAALHATLSLARIDAALGDHASLVAARIRAEIEEEGDLEAAVTEAVDELELPGTGVAVLSPADTLFTTRAADVRRPAARELQSAAFDAGAGNASRDGLRFHLGRIESDATAVRVLVWTSLATHEQERATVRRALWFGGPLALLVAAFGGWLVGRHGLRPLEEMTREAEAMSADGPDTRLSLPPRHDELGVLASAFNRLLDRLASTLRVQRQFMADASHQIRTPVSIVRSAADVVLGGPERTAEDYRDALTVIAAQARRLTQMIERMLTLTLADLHARPLQPTDFYLDELVQDGARAMRALAADRHVHVRVDAMREVQFRGDEELLRQLVMNLAENAVRHTPPHGTVTLALSVADDIVSLSVSDEGAGIAARDQARIFDRFVRLDTADSAGGAGLGLPIAQWVAEAHGGTLQLASSGPRGSCFVATLPMQPGPSE